MIDDTRYEVKFKLDQKSYTYLQNWLYSKTPFLRVFENRKVNSLYFDDLGYNSVKDNLSGVANRYKYRLRWYDGGLSAFDDVIFEEKARIGRVGKKRFLKIPFARNDLFSVDVNRITREINKQVFSGSSKLTSDYLFPTLLVNYEREYFCDNKGIRITIDKNLNFAAPLAQKAVTEHKMIGVSSRVLEVKFDMSCKNEAQAYISKINLPPVRNSKYLTALAVLNVANYL